MRYALIPLSVLDLASRFLFPGEKETSLRLFNSPASKAVCLLTSPFK